MPKRAGAALNIAREAPPAGHSVPERKFLLSN
jgi:hypothetical protein